MVKGAVWPHLEAIVVCLSRLEQARGGHTAPPGSHTGGIPSRSGQQAVLLSHRGRLHLPQTPSQSSEALKGLFLHWGLSVPGALLRSSGVGSRMLASLALPRRRHREPSLSSLAKLGTSRWADGQARPILGRHRQFSCLGPKGPAKRASSSSLSLGGALPLPDPPPIVVASSSSTVCSRS